MTLNEILADLRSNRIKKVILDCDAYNDIDDEYAIAFAVGSDKMEVLSVNAALFDNPRVNGYEDGMNHSYEQIKKVLKLIGADNIPVFKGCPTTVTLTGGAVQSPAVDSIIKTARESDEIIYILTTGASTNVSSAIMTDPSIKENICVVWIGCNTLDFNLAGDYNYGQDNVAGRYLLDCGANLIVLPAIGPEGFGTQTIIGDQAYLDRMIKGDSDAAVFFRNYLPDFAFAEEGEPLHHFWDIAAPAIIEVPEAFELSVVTTPRIRLDGTWAFEENRPQSIFMSRLDADKVMDVTFEIIGKLCQ